MTTEGRAGLGLLDRLVLVVAWLVTCGIVYVFGVYMGREIGGRPAGVDTGLVRLPVTATPPPAGERPQAENDLTFYDTLVAPGSREGAEPVPPPAAPAPAAPPPVASAPPPAAPPAARPAAPPPAVAEPATPPEAAPASGGWTVQANPTRDRAEAEALYRRLRGRGYDVALVRVPRDGDTWYRVRIGRYASAEGATAMVRRLREEEGVAHVFVASE